MKTLKLLVTFGIILYSINTSAQYLPESFQPMLNEIVTNFETIVGSNSISQGKTTLSVINENKIALRTQHKGKDKNLTFETQPDEEGRLYWVAANPLTIDMVNKYEKDLTKILESMYNYSVKKSKE